MGSDQEHRYETALTFVFGVDFRCVLLPFSSPTRWSGSRGRILPETFFKTAKTEIAIFILSLNVTESYFSQRAGYFRRRESSPVGRGDVPPSAWLGVGLAKDVAGAVGANDQGGGAKEVGAEV